MLSSQLCAERVAAVPPSASRWSSLPSSDTKIKKKKKHTRRSPHGSRQHLTILSPASEPCLRREAALERPIGAWIRGRGAVNRHVAARMPAKCVSRFLLLAWICAVPEARAKSLPDQGALGKPCGGDAAQWGDGSGCPFHGFFFFSVDGPCTPTARSPAWLQEVNIRGANFSMCPLYDARFAVWFV